MGVIMNSANYTLPYNGMSRQLNTIGPYKIYSLKRDGKSFYFVMLKSKVLCCVNKYADAVAYAKERYGKTR